MKPSAQRERDRVFAVLDMAPRIPDPYRFRRVATGLRPLAPTTKKQRDHLKNLGFKWDGFAWSKARKSG